LKIGLFAAILHAFVKFEPLQKHALFLAALYTALIAFISYVFIMAPRQGVWPRQWEYILVKRLLGGTHTEPAVFGWRAWQAWLVETFLLTAFYLKLLRRFDEGPLFWIILVLGMGLIVF
jgi:hypothetical protein